MVPGEGFEPPTRGLSGHRSTPELPRHWAAVKSGGMKLEAVAENRTRDLIRMKDPLYR